MPSGRDPMGGDRFSGKIMLRIKREGRSNGKRILDRARRRS
jgi:hypothetical protein